MSGSIFLPNSCRSKIEYDQPFSKVESVGKPGLDLEEDKEEAEDSKQCNCW